MKYRILTLSLSTLCLTMLLSAAAFAEGPKRIMVNITAADVNRAAMGVSFAHAAMKNEGLEGVLFFSVTGVDLVNAKRPSPIYPTGQSIAQMIQAFMDDGGTVIACPMCMKHLSGMTNDDLMAGVQAKKGMGVKAAVAADTLVMTY